jgi:hypothetical protein
VRAAGPHYDPETVERLARQGLVVATLRVTTWLVNHDYDAAAVLVEVLGSLTTQGRWLSSCVLAHAEIADEYAVHLEGVEWYVKFWVDRQHVVVSVWSCWWQGAAH